jgi:hypothetical protein
MKRHVTAGNIHTIQQASGHFKGWEIEFDATTKLWRVVDQAGNPETAKGLQSKIDGTLMVHLVDDFSDNDLLPEQMVFCPIPVHANVQDGYLFDYILETGSTAELFTEPNLLIWL